MSCSALSWGDGSGLGGFGLGGLPGGRLLLPVGGGIAAGKLEDGHARGEDYGGNSGSTLHLREAYRDRRILSKPRWRPFKCRDETAGRS